MCTCPVSTRMSSGLNLSALSTLPVSVGWHVRQSCFIKTCLFLGVILIQCFCLVFQRDPWALRGGVWRRHPVQGLVMQSLSLSAHCLVVAPLVNYQQQVPQTRVPPSAGLVESSPHLKHLSFFQWFFLPFGIRRPEDFPTSVLSSVFIYCDSSDVYRGQSYGNTLCHIPCIHTAFL